MQKITSANIMQFANEKCGKLKSSILDILSGKLICLKIDTATRSNRGDLCVNAQIFLRDKIEIITLAMEEIQGRHTADNIRVIMEKVIGSYDIKKEQIYTVTTDDGRNFIKAVELLAETASHDDNDDDDDIDDDDETASYVFSGNVLKPIIGDHIISVKCAAHTLQLAVKVFLEEYSPGIVSSSRRVVKILRTPLMRLKVRDQNLVKPQLDVLTRWSSTYNMMGRLCQLRDFCAMHLRSSENLSIDEWKLVESIVAVLALPHSLTLKLQESRFIFSKQSTQ
ncbi:PREDICTED: uncharacterized protein LOC108364691 [Rhagoletis zephyria]|uniref:uncharacterized protein LOC108364691 n=1 Tax=Rhagoletis zephyria TaxID=28612 RepID=UPI00081136F1|nr:PREDICTED: uncharacterized protein LOC108364691 [Rhagoletis zephyria]